MGCFSIFDYQITKAKPYKWVLLLGALLGLLLTGCGATATLLNSAGSTAPDGSPLPGTEEYGLSRQELVSKIEAVEADIATCMSDAGFEYVAADYNTVRRGMVSDKSLPGMTERQYFNEYGYGISTLYTGKPPQLEERATPAQIGLGDRNVEIFRNLSPADQVAYNQTLIGENSNVTFAVAIEIEDLGRTGGCTRAAIEKSFTEEQLTATYRNPKDALIEQDPRMVEAIGKYSECMREAGFDYNHEKDIEPDLRNRVEAITGGQPLEALSPDALAALGQLQEYERALAIASYECEVDYLEPAEDAIERELYSGRKS